MRRRLHVLLCWLLLVTLPLQGWATAGMALCTAVHAGLGVNDALPLATQPPQEPCHAHAQPGHHGAGHLTPDTLPAAGPGEDAASLPDPAAPWSAADVCALCAWCAHAASSLPATGGACPAGAVERGFEPVPRALPTLSFLTPGVERPPR